MRIVVAGAGAVGFFVGGCLAAAGHDVVLLGRGPVLSDIAGSGLRLSDHDGLSLTVDPARLELSEDPACLGGAELILVTVKSGATAAMAALIAEHGPLLTPVISLQNGVQAVGVLRDALAQRDVRAGMVPFNVVCIGSGSYHRATSGGIVL
ncbi:MAG: hypothetical protein OIF47_03535 [Marinibacterium sp.]|nr:hypothetical protein [Marinibacterium sp.]